MILLGLNCGFGNADVATLPFKALNLQAGWIEYERPKTGIDRKCPLWPKTIEAINAAIEKRPTPKDKADAGLVFVTKYGGRWVRQEVIHLEKEEGEEGEAEKLKVRTDDAITKEFRKLLDNLNLHKDGCGFYALRHVFETQAGEAKDQVAVDAVMGHVDAAMGANYRHGVSAARLLAVVDQVHDWLFGVRDVPATETRKEAEIKVKK
jgi:integrase